MCDDLFTFKNICLFIRFIVRYGYCHVNKKNIANEMEKMTTLPFCPRCKKNDQMWQKSHFETERIIADDFVCLRCHERISRRHRRISLEDYTV